MLLDVKKQIVVQLAEWWWWCPGWRNMRDIVAPPLVCMLCVTQNRLNWQCVQWRHVVTSLWASPNFLRNLLHPSLHLDLSFVVHLLNKQCLCWQMLTACTWQMLTAWKWWIVHIKVVSTKKIFVWAERRGIWWNLWFWPIKEHLCQLGNVSAADSEI